MADSDPLAKAAEALRAALEKRLCEGCRGEMQRRDNREPFFCRTCGIDGVLQDAPNLVRAVLEAARGGGCTAPDVAACSLAPYAGCDRCPNRVRSNAAATTVSREGVARRDHLR